MDAVVDNQHILSSIPGTPSPQFPLLNYFFPGFSIFFSAANASLGSIKGGIEGGAYLPLILAAVVATSYLWSHVSSQIWGLISDYFISSICIRTDDEIYNMVMLWASRQRFAQKSRHILANTEIHSHRNWTYGTDDPDDSDDESEKASEKVEDSIVYIPAPGKYWFWYRGRLLAFERLENYERNNLQGIMDRDQVFLWCFGRSPQLIKDLLVEACRIFVERDERKTIIYRSNFFNNSWQRCMSRLNRPLSTVILDETIKQQLIDDITDYMSPATRRWYSNRGIPYRRGFLLYGPPGTGKSSLSLALAGHFRIKIYIASLSSSSTTEENLMSLFNDLPNRCIVLLEDIDTAGLTHTRDDAAAAEVPPTPSSDVSSTDGNSPDAAHSSSGRGRLSLSGLLNILDGVASQEGRILIMTTNHIDKLDKALIRPGRVDMMIPFGPANASMVISMFRAIYSSYENETTDGGNNLSNGSCKEAAKTEGNSGDGRAGEKSLSPVADVQADEGNNINELAQKFADAMPENEFSPAEIQGLLLRHKRNPEAAIDAVDDWVAQMRNDKEAKRVDKGAGDGQEEEEAEA